MFALLQEELIPRIPLDDWTEGFVDYITEAFSGFFEALEAGLVFFVEDVFERAFTAPPALLMIAALAAIAFFVAGWRIGVFAVAGFLLIISLGLWEEAMLTLALILASAIIALILGVPLGIITAQSRVLEAIVRPILDVMQTMPAFVYLVPIVVLLSVGSGPALVAVVIFAMPPAVRLTILGIQQVPGETVEAAKAFGATPWQTLLKVELPQALPTIMAGVNQVIMLSLSMVVIAALVGAGGLGSPVVQGLSRVDVGQSFVGGLGIVIIAIYLDRVTRRLGRQAGPPAKGA